VLICTCCDRGNIYCKRGHAAECRRTKQRAAGQRLSAQPTCSPTSASWLNAIECLFATLTKRRLKRGVFRSVHELKDAIHRFLDDINANPKPFTWTNDPKEIIAAVSAEQPQQRPRLIGLLLELRPVHAPPKLIFRFDHVQQLHTPAPACCTSPAA
jgi:hypothetical protein